MKKPCLDCGRPTSNTRCEGCAQTWGSTGARAAHKQRRRGRRPQYGGDYRTEGGRVRAINVCWICGQPGTPDDPMQADHLIPAAINPGGVGGEGGLAPAHRSCNIRRAHALRRARRRAAEKAELDRRLHRDG